MQSSPKWRCNFLHFYLQLLVFLLCNKQKPSNLPIYEPFTKDEFIKGIAELHIGEWKRSYVDPMVLDGTQWSIDIEYEGDHKPVHIDGSNAFPYNFDDLLEFLGVNEEGDEDEV